MKAITRILERSPKRSLNHVVEPLADLICASEKPDVVLRSIISVLRRQVRTTNRIADHFARSQRSLSQAV